MNDIVWFIATLKKISGSTQLTSDDVTHVLTDAVSRFQAKTLTLAMFLDLIRTIHTYQSDNLSPDMLARLTVLSWSLNYPQVLELDDKKIENMVGRLLMN